MVYITSLSVQFPIQDYMKEVINPKPKHETERKGQEERKQGGQYEGNKHGYK